jgi:hypothetical protein
VTADHQKVVRTQEDLKVDLLEDQKEDLQEAVILTDPAMTQEPHVDLEHREQNQAIVFQESANHLMESVSRTKAEIVNHSIAIIVRAVSVVHSEIASHLMASVNRTKEEIASRSTAKVESVVHSETASHLMVSVNRSTATTAKVVNANHIKEENASLLAELKIQHVHLTRAIIAGIAMRPQK